VCICRRIVSSCCGIGHLSPTGSLVGCSICPDCTTRSRKSRKTGKKVLRPVIDRLLCRLGQLGTRQTLVGTSRMRLSSDSCCWISYKIRNFEVISGNWCTFYTLGMVFFNYCDKYSWKRLTNSKCRCIFVRQSGGNKARCKMKDVTLSNHSMFFIYRYPITRLSGGQVVAYPLAIGSSWE